MKKSVVLVLWLVSILAPALRVYQFSQRSTALYNLSVSLVGDSLFQILFFNAVAWSCGLSIVGYVRLLLGKISTEEFTQLQDQVLRIVFDIGIAFMFNGAYLDTVGGIQVVGVIIARLLHKLASFRLDTFTQLAAPRRLDMFCFVIFLTTLFMFDLLGGVFVIEQITSGRTRRRDSIVIAMELIGMFVSAGALGLNFVFESYERYLRVAWNEKTKMKFYVKVASDVLVCASYLMLLMNQEDAMLSAFTIRVFAIHGVKLYKSVNNFMNYRWLRRQFEHMPSPGPHDLAHDAQCSICLSDMDSPPMCKKLPCGHSFHTLCLTQWLENHQTCPYCRQKIQAAPAQAPAAPGAAAAAPAAAAAADPAAAAPARVHAQAAPAAPFNQAEEVRNAYQQYLAQAAQAANVRNRGAPAAAAAAPAAAAPASAPAAAPARTPAPSVTDGVRRGIQVLAEIDMRFVEDETDQDEVNGFDEAKARATIQAYKRFARSVRLAQLTLDVELGALEAAARHSSSTQ